MSNYPNYLWVNIPNAIVVGVNPAYVIAPLRECDCFDFLTVAITYSGNTSLNSISLVINWRTDSGILLYAETVGSSSLSSTTLSTTATVKGANCSLSLLGAGDSNFQILGTAILGVYRG